MLIQVWRCIADQNTELRRSNTPQKTFSNFVSRVLLEIEYVREFPEIWSTTFPRIRISPDSDRFIFLPTKWNKKKKKSVLWDTNETRFGDGVANSVARLVHEILWTSRFFEKPAFAGNVRERSYIMCLVYSSGTIESNGLLEWNGMEWNGMEWNGMESLGMGSLTLEL